MTLALATPVLGFVDLVSTATIFATQIDLHTDVPRFLAVLGIMLVVGKFSGELFERLGQPAVMGELLAGVLLGASVVGIIPINGTDSLSEPFKLFAEIGVLLLLFEIGLETDLKQLVKVGRASMAVAFTGVTLPMALGIGLWLSPLVPTELNLADPLTTAVFVGATLTATSVGITARVLTDLRVMSSIEAKMIIGAAVIDDILGLVLLGIVSAVAAGAAMSALDVSLAFGLAIGFIVGAVFVGFWIMPRVFDVVVAMKVRGMLVVVAFSFVMLLAAAADALGSAMIIGAFAAGLILSRTNQFDLIRLQVKPVADVFTPVFFMSIGAQLDVRLLNPFIPGNSEILFVAFMLFLVGVVGKLLSGWSVWWRSFNRLAVGFGMMPRGEVGLIFAQIGLSAGVLSSEVFSAVLLMVIGTTFLAPALVKWSFSRDAV